MTPMKPPARRMPREERRKQLLIAAEHVFGTKGYTHTLMDDIADYAGISKPVLYQHFDGKKDMYLYLMDQQFNELEDSLDDCLYLGQTPEQSIHCIVASIFNLVDDEGSKIPIILDSFTPDPEIQEHRRNGVRKVMKLLDRTGVSDDFVTGPFSDFLVFCIASTISEATRFWSRDLARTGTVDEEAPRMTREQAIGALTHMLMYGVTNAAAAT